MYKSLNAANASIKVYNGYGHKNNIILYGHVFAQDHFVKNHYSNNPLINILHLIRLFLIKPKAGCRLRMYWGNQVIETISEQDGFFKFEWASLLDIAAGWHKIEVKWIEQEGDILAVGTGKIFVPHSTQFAFISDIDDTLLISHSASAGKKLRLLFGRNPRTRKTFEHVVSFYQKLSVAHTIPSIPNPFFYVSSSEWNLYEYLTEFFRYNLLPEGVLMLNKIKRFSALFKTGKSNHEIKFLRIVRILEAFPKQRFVLIGDNAQHDPEIYASIANKFPEKIEAIYIRKIRPSMLDKTMLMLSAISNKSIPICLFDSNLKAINHAISIGLIENENATQSN